MQYSIKLCNFSQTGFFCRFLEIVGIGKGAVDGIVDFGNKIGNGVVDVGKKIGSGVVDVGKKIGDGFGKAIDKIKDFGKGIGNAFKSIFGSKCWTFSAVITICYQ